jgi:hypothetical protein
MTTHTRIRRVSVPAYYLGRPAALWLAALAPRGRPLTNHLARRAPAKARCSSPAAHKMTTTSTGLATAAYQELAAAPRAAVITPGDRGHDQAPQSLSQPC